MSEIRRVLGGAWPWALNVAVFCLLLRVAYAVRRVNPPFLPDSPWFHWLFVLLVVIGLTCLMLAPGLGPGSSRIRRLGRVAGGVAVCAAAGALVGAELSGRLTREALARGWASMVLLVGVGVLMARAGPKAASKILPPAAILTTLVFGLWITSAIDLVEYGADLWTVVADGSVRPEVATPAEPRVPSPLDYVDPENRAPAKPTGLFAESPVEGTLGWHWMTCADRWREALVVQPPARLRARAPTPADGRLRIYVGLAKQVRKRGRGPVAVRCTADDVNGNRISEVRFEVSQADDGRTAWAEIALDVSAAATEDIDLTLVAKPLPSHPSGTATPLLAIAAPTPTRVAGPSGPNCVVIMVDALRADRLHCYGFPEKASPAADRLAAEGTLFERVESACSWTVPSVASLFTGTFVATHGMSEFRMPGRLSLPALAEQLGEAGMRTAGVSANRLVVPPAGFGAGFEEFIGSPKFDGGGDAPDADWVTDQGIGFLRQFKGQRFFLYLHYMDPHMEYKPPKKWTRFGWTDQQRYLGEILFCNTEVARFLAELDAQDRAEDTLVVFLSDHGEAFMEHGFRGHGHTLYSEEVRVPLILRWPGRIPKSHRVTSQVRSIDVHATILDLMGRPIPRHVEGETLVPLMSDGADTPDRFAVGETGKWQDRDPRLTSLCDGRYRLILHRELGTVRLYDLLADPDERIDISRQRAGAAASMTRSLRLFLQRRERTAARPRRPMSDLERRMLQGLGYIDPTKEDAPPRRVNRRNRPAAGR